MTTEELEEKLEGQGENQNIEFKQACDWDINLFVKDILAMANVRDGGYIIVGVEDGTFARHGISDAQKGTYLPETIQDQIGEFADPFVSLNISFPEDFDRRKYVVIRVAPFEDIPIICRRDGRDIHRGTIYYRSRSGRTQSSPVRNSSDMRDIIQTATVRMMQRTKDMGFVVSSSEEEALNSELEGL